MRPGVGQSLRKDQDGVILVEALIALPILLLLTVGILEFGNMMWQRMQVQAGVRDAARYWSRCRPEANGLAFMSCSIDKAQRIAVHGNPDGTGPARVPGWTLNDVSVEPAILPANPGNSDLVTVSTSFDYQGSPFYDAVLDGTIKIGYWAQMRYIGW